MKVTALFQDLFSSERIGGILLVICSIVSLAITNLRGDGYAEFWHHELAGRPLEFWINDGLMTVFFLLVGLELERELYIGELSQTNTIARDAGLQPNDVIVAVDGQPVKKPQDLVTLISAHKGTPANVTIQRPGEPQTRSITVTPDADGKIGIAIGVHQELKYEKVGVGQAAVQTVTYNVELPGGTIISDTAEASRPDLEAMDARPKPGTPVAVLYSPKYKVTRLL